MGWRPYSVEELRELWPSWVVVDPETGCWLWQRTRDRSGHGRLKAAAVSPGRSLAAYRVAYIIFVGSIPDGVDCHHVCETPACTNPAHLEFLAHGDHTRRHAGPTCSRGHGPEHWRMRVDGRYCRACDAARKRAARRDPARAGRIRARDRARKRRLQSV